MASTRSCLILLAILAAFAYPISGKEFIVGDDKGWSLGVDYQAWAAGKDFVVGDTLVFKYTVGAHNVFKVNGTGFQQCIKPALTEALTTGNDVITLALPGRKWYICGVAKHCELGNMKLFINVVPQSLSPSLAPSPATTSAAGKFAEPKFYGFIAALFGTLLLVLV